MVHATPIPNDSGSTRRGHSVYPRVPSRHFGTVDLDAVLGSRILVGKGESMIPTDQKAKEIVETLGCDYLGSTVVQRRFGASVRMYQFRDKTTGSSLAVFQDEMTAPIVAHKLERSRATFLVHQGAA